MENSKQNGYFIKFSLAKLFFWFCLHCSSLLDIQYVQKGHPILAISVDLILQPRKFKVFVAIDLNRLSSLQTPLGYISLVYSFLFSPKVFRKADDGRNRSLEIF